MPEWVLWKGIRKLEGCWKKYIKKTLMFKLFMECLALERHLCHPDREMPCISDYYIDISKTSFFLLSGFLSRWERSIIPSTEGHWHLQYNSHGLSWHPFLFVLLFECRQPLLFFQPNCCFSFLRLPQRHSLILSSEISPALAEAVCFMSVYCAGCRVQGFRDIDVAVKRDSLFQATAV